jgi:short subunit dehydrogenase-like uncharacterized protein
MTIERAYDVIVYGASGYTGRLVAEYLSQTYSGTDLKWAMAGRDAAKLAAVRDEIGAPKDTPLVIADASDPVSLKAMVLSTKVVATTVGPYQLYGNELVEACAAHGVDYVDLCGEPGWMREMIDAHGAAAKASGARIVFSCGFDSIPFDLGVLFLQNASKDRIGWAMPRVRGRVRAMKGTFSGGTKASLQATMAAAAKNPELISLLRSSFALTPGFEGPKQPHGMAPIEEADLGSWSAPFIMAPINTKNVHRTNALLHHAYGTDFVYDEMLFTGPGEKGKAMAEAVAGDRSLGSSDGPKPGEGPSKEERETGYYDVLFIGSDDKGNVIKAGVKGDRDPGYGSTSKMIAEAAICLAKDGLTTPGGIWTPGAAMGEALIGRLENRAGLTFKLED